MTNMPHNTQDWREEFRKKCVNSLRMDGNQTLQLTDFISNLLTAQLQNVVEELEGEKFVNPAEAGQFAMHSDGFNQGIEEAQQLLLRKIMENKIHG